MATVLERPKATATRAVCRFCGSRLQHEFCDLGASPIANAYLTQDQLGMMEPFFPLRVFVCDECYLVQVQDFEGPEAIFAADYAYYSSFSSSWLAHCERYTDEIVARFGLTPDSGRIVEVASNDGYLLQYFLQRGFDVLGIEPAAGVAQAAAVKGVPTVQRFFGTELADELAATAPARLLIGNNVLAHVPDLNDFVAGLRILLAADGLLTMEFPHLPRLVEEGQFDTIYHEHFSYFTLLTVRRIFASHGLEIFDVEQLPTHGGSLRIYARHSGTASPTIEGRVDELEAWERANGFGDLDVYLSFPSKVRSIKIDVLRAIVAASDAGATIVAYGAPAKGNTLLNYCGVGPELLPFTVDLSPHKQGLYLPGTHIPIRAPEAIVDAKPDIVFILPWNLREEIMQQLSYIREWGGRFLVRTPEVRLLP